MATEEINKLLQRVAKLEVALLKGKISSIDEVLRQSEEEGRTTALKRDSRQSYVVHSRLETMVDKVKRISKKGLGWRENQRFMMKYLHVLLCKI